MLQFSLTGGLIQIKVKREALAGVNRFLERRGLLIICACLSFVSVFYFLFYYANGLGIAYNDARSHLNIARRVVEGLKPGLAQLGSVWLPLLHLLMVPTVWNDFMWHSGLAGALPSMISYVFCGVLIYQLLRELGVGVLGRFVGVFIFAFNLNVLYLQSTAMTELLLLATMTAGVYELCLWHKNENLFHLILSAFWIMLATLVRYDAWFLFLFTLVLIILHVYRRKGYSATEGIVILFSSLAAFGIFLWLVWNQLIFKDPLYFAFGPFSAHSQQQLLEQAGNLMTKGNFGLSIKFYLFALAYNQGAFVALLGLLGLVVLLLDSSLKKAVRMATLALTAPFLFNVIALFFGHSVLHIQGLSGNTWFNARYGIMMAPSVAVFIGFLIHKLKPLRWVILGLLSLVMFFTYVNFDAVTIDDALFGASQKNVSEVSRWLQKNAAHQRGLILISVASHDAIIFSSGLPMKRFIHEGTDYWEKSTAHPSQWARWIIMRLNDQTDLTFRGVNTSLDFKKYRLMEKYPFADIYELKGEYLGEMSQNPIFTQIIDSQP